MAGSHPDFPAQEFRAGIREAMLMGFPGATLQRPTFRWVTERTFTGAGVSPVSGRPYDWGKQPAASAKVADLQVTCVAIQAKPSMDLATAVGEFDETKLTVVLLDDEYDELLTHGAGDLPDVILLGATEYTNVIELQTMGLFDVDVHTLFGSAADTSAVTT